MTVVFRKQLPTNLGENRDPHLASPTRPRMHVETDRCVAPLHGSVKRHLLAGLSTCVAFHSAAQAREPLSISCYVANLTKEQVYTELEREAVRSTPSEASPFSAPCLSYMNGIATQRAKWRARVA